jgi:hypothetical protein
MINMTAEDAINWLIGFLEASGDEGLTDKQVKFILIKLEGLGPTKSWDRPPGMKC